MMSLARIFLLSSLVMVQSIAKRVTCPPMPMPSVTPVSPAPVTETGDKIPLYGRSCSSDKMCGDYNGHDLKCIGNMCSCKPGVKCWLSAKPNHASEYQQCSTSKPCYGHGMKCSGIDGSCQTKQEELQCFKKKDGGYKQCLILSVCLLKTEFDCANPILP